MAFTNEYQKELCKEFKEKNCKGCPLIFERATTNCLKDHSYNQKTREWTNDKEDKNNA